MITETKDILYKLKNEGIGASIAGMHRGIQLLEQLIESDKDTALKYFKGVAAACEHISGKMLDENYVPSKSQMQEKTVNSVSKVVPTSQIAGAAFILDGMEDISHPTTTNSVAKPEMSKMQSMADSIL